MDLLTKNDKVDDVDGDVQRLLLQAFDGVVDLRDPVDEVRSIQIRHQLRLRNWTGLV